MATDRVRLPALQPQIISASRNRLQPFPIRPVPASHRCIPLPTGSRRNQLPPFPPGRSSPTVADCHRRCKTHSRCQPRPTAGPPSLMQSATYYNRFHPGQLPPAVAESQPSNLKPGSSKAPSSPPSRRYPRPTEIFQPRIVGKAATDYHPFHLVQSPTALALSVHAAADFPFSPRSVAASRGLLPNTIIYIDGGSKASATSSCVGRASTVIQCISFLPSFITLDSQSIEPGSAVQIETEYSPFLS